MYPIIRIFNIEQLFRESKEKQISLQCLLDNEIYINGLKKCNVEYSEELLVQLADIISKGLYKGKEARETLKYGILQGLGDTSYLQCFYLTEYKGAFIIKHMLNSEVYNYCKRRFKQSIKHT